MVESGVDAYASDTICRASGEDCVGRFSKVLLPPCSVDYHTKKLALCGTRSSPHFAQNGRSHPKFSERYFRLTCARVANLARTNVT